MGCNPVLAVVAGVAVGGYGILPGFVAGYIVGFVAPFLEKKLPEGLNLIVGALAIAPLQELLPSQLIRSLIQHCSTSDV